MHVRVHLEPALGHLRLADLRPEHIRSFFKEKEAAGLSPNSVRRIATTLRRALKDAVADGLVERNAATLVRPPKAERHLVIPPDPAVVLKLAEAARGHRVFEAFIPLVMATGLRHREALALTWDRLKIDDRERASVSVPHTLQRKKGEGLAPAATKTDASCKTIYLPKSIADSLVAHRARQEHERLMAGGEWPDHNLVFRTERGMPVDVSTNLHAFHRLQDKAGVPRCRVHDLRHAFVTYLLALGEDLRVVMEMARHSSICVTADIYAHVMPAVGRRAADKMDDLLTGKVSLD